MNRGWYVDPTGRYAERYFDGRAWTDQVRGAGALGVAPGGDASAAPIPPPSAPPSATRPTPRPWTGDGGAPTAPSRPAPGGAPRFGRIGPAAPPGPAAGPSPAGPSPLGTAGAGSFPDGPAATGRAATGPSPLGPPPVGPPPASARVPWPSEPPASVDPTATFRVPAAPAAGAARSIGRLGAAGSPPWLLIAAVVSVVVLVGGGIAWARSRGGEPSRSDGRSTSASPDRPGGGPAVDGGEESYDDVPAGERSPEAYCEVLETELRRLEDEYATEQAGIDTDDPGLADILAAFGLLAGLPSDLARIFEKAEQVAPPEIEVETRELKENFRSQADRMGALAGDAASDPLAALFGGLATALVEGAQMQRPIERFDAYTSEHCDLGA